MVREISCVCVCVPSLSVMCDNKDDYVEKIGRLCWRTDEEKHLRRERFDDIGL